MDSKILITGTHGFIGSHFAKYFNQLGFTVYGLDRNPPLPEVTPYLYRNCEADLADTGCVSAFVRKHELRYVLHCAALCLVGESVQKPDLYFDNNVRRSEIFLQDALLANGVKGIVFSSTAATFGEPSTPTIDETHPQRPINPYGESKLAYERTLLRAESEKKILVGILRYFNAAGADPDGEMGENHDPETHLIPNACNAALGHRGALEIFGDDYPTRDGTCERDYVHVFDLADAHARLLRKIQTEGTGGAYNLGLGRGYTIREVLQTVERVTGLPVPHRTSARRPGDPAILVANPKKAMRELGWAPRHSDLENLVRTAFSWQRKRRSR